jgi:hypothetical protein
MNPRSILSISAMTTLALAMLPSNSIAQQKSLKDQLVGTWVIVSSDSTAPDGSKLQVFGPNPKGILVFDASGQTVQIIVNPGVPKFKINNRLKGTPEENTAAVHGTTATFGTFTVDESSKTITVRNAGGMFPGLAGTDTKRIVTSATADELKFTNPATAAGMRADNVWRRAK